MEFRDHKAALMGLRWLNAHEVTKSELLEGLTDEEKKLVDVEGLTRRRLCVEFAIENANVVKRRRELTKGMRESSKRKLEEAESNETQQDDNKKAKTVNSTDGNSSKSGVDENIKRLIGFKRKRKQGKK